MRNISEDTITQAVLASFSECKDKRLWTIMTSLVQHLHAFARDVNLTEEEWFKAIQFLTDAGHITDDKRQEFILLSDTLGLSMLVMSQNNKKPAQCTEATVFDETRLAARPRSYVRHTTPPLPSLQLSVQRAESDGASMYELSCGHDLMIAH